MIAVGVTNIHQKRAVLLHLLGSDGQEIFDTLPDTGNEFKTVIKKLDDYFQPKCNMNYEWCAFLSARQKANETIDSYVTHFRGLDKTCKYAKEDEMIREHVVMSCDFAHLWQHLLHNQWNTQKPRQNWWRKALVPSINSFINSLYTCLDPLVTNHHQQIHSTKILENVTIVGNQVTWPMNQHA